MYNALRSSSFPVFSSCKWNEHSFQMLGKKNLAFDGIPAGRHRLLNGGLIQVNVLRHVRFD